MKKQEEQLQKLLQYLDSLSYIPAKKIPDIDLYMDQVTTFMDEHLSDTKRYEEDKVLTKTMINNYAKNNLLPPPVKKRYSKQHMLMLIFIYYFKNMLSLTDIEELFRPITQEHFFDDSPLSLEDIYQEVFSLEKEQKKRLKEESDPKIPGGSDHFFRCLHRGSRIFAAILFYLRTWFRYLSEKAGDGTADRSVPRRI